MAGIEKIAQPSGGGLSTVQELYDIINGKTTSTSGGTQTTSGSTVTQTENNAISKEGMDAMLANILGGTQGLASVSQGQRSAGGYGSSVNTMLTNDLLTRSASSVAALNATKTSTKTSTPETTTRNPSSTTAGGVTPGGTAKMASALALLNGYSKITGSKDGDLLKKAKELFGMGSADSSLQGVGPNSSFNAVNGSDLQSDQFVSAQSSSNSSPSFNVSNDLSWGDSSPTFDVSADQSFGSDNSSSSYFDVSNDWQPDVSTPSNADSFVNEDYGQYFADGGEIDTDAMKKKSNVLSTSQFSELTPTVEDNVSGGFNAMNVVAPLKSAPANPIGSSQPTNITESGGGGGDNGTNGAGQANANGGFGTVNGGQIGAALGTLGNLAGSPALGAIGTAIGIGSSPDKGKSTLGAVAGSLGLGAIGSSVRDPSIGNIADIALSVANPAFGMVNSMLGIAGLATLGQIGVNAFGNVGVNNPIGPAQQAAINAPTPAQVVTPNVPSVNPAIDTSIGNGGNDSSNDSSAEAGGDIGNEGSVSVGDGFGDNDMGGDTSSDNGAGPGSDSNTGSGSDSTNGSDSNSDAGADSFNDGGHISGPGTGISDDINIKVSDGEFVLSADVVKAIGIDKLNALQDKYHVPAAVQRLKSIGKGR